ncbi:MAG: hypothetical protein ACFCUQ_15535 [Kiloniellales bacterium]
MANFVQLTKKHNHEPVRVNFEVVSAFVALGGGSRISFPGSEADYIDVVETPDAIAQLLGTE